MITEIHEAEKAVRYVLACNMAVPSPGQPDILKEYVKGCLERDVSASVLEEAINNLIG